MIYKIKLNDRPFNAIKYGTKKVEGRTPTSLDKTPYNKMKIGDICIFINNETSEKITTILTGIKHYSNIKELLINEGVKNVLSSGVNLERGIENFNNFFEYKENMVKYGIFALNVRLQNTNFEI